MVDQNLVTLIQKNIQKQQLIKADERILVATSAGVDSQVLLAIMAQLYPAENVIVAHVNHDLRPEAAMEANFVATQAQFYGFDYVETTWQRTHELTTGIEAAGREIRYTFLQSMAKKYQIKTVLTAHHANDLTETFLMKLLRGGRWEQLSAIAWKRQLNPEVNLVRPMLNIQKDQLINYAREHGIKWYEDISNHDDYYTRNRIRNQLVPMLKAEAPQVVEHINNYAHQFSQVEQMIQMQANQYLTTALATRDWTNVPRIWFAATIKAYLYEVKPMLSIKEEHLKQIEQLFYNVKHPNGQITLTAGVVIVKEYKDIFLSTQEELLAQPVTINKDVVITLNKWHLLPNGGKFIVKPKVSEFNDLKVTTRFSLHLKLEQLPLKIRYRHPGDKISLKQGHQKIKKVMIDEKIPVNQRDNIPVLVDKYDNVLWLVGFKNTWTDVEQANYEVLYILKDK